MHGGLLCHILYDLGLTLVRTSLSRPRGSASLALRSKGEGVILHSPRVSRLTPLRIYIYVLLEKESKRTWKQEIQQEKKEIYIVNIVKNPPNQMSWL